MVAIEEASNNISDELGDAGKYAKLALEFKDQYRSLADTYFTLSNEEMRHQQLLHNEVVKLIDEYRRTKGEPPAAMLAVYDYLHKQAIDKAEKVRRYQAMYKD